MVDEQHTNILDKDVPRLRDVLRRYLLLASACALIVLGIVLIRINSWKSAASLPLHAAVDTQQTEDRAPEDALPPLPDGVTICLDPGHPSEVHAGKVVQNGLTEVDVNWKVAIELFRLLQDQKINVVLTKRRVDDYISNSQRAAIANAHQADLFLRLHCDTGAGSGYTLYYPDRQGTAQNTRGPSNEIIAASKEAATLLQQGMAPRLTGQLKNNGIKGDSATAVGRKQGALTGSIFSNVPVVSVEMLFLSNKSDVQFLKQHDGITILAAALADGVVHYLRNFPDTEYTAE